MVSVRLPRKAALGMAAVLLLTAGTAVVLATHNPQVSDVVAVATSPTWNMTCSTGSGVTCTATNANGPWTEQAVIKPPSGNLTTLSTSAFVFIAPLDSIFRSWLSQLHSVACAPGRI